MAYIFDFLSFCDCGNVVSSYKGVFMSPCPDCEDEETTVEKENESPDEDNDDDEDREQNNCLLL